MRLRHAFGSRWASSLEYRLYVDDWGMIGHTEAAELSFEPRRDLVVRLRERGTLQSGAKFYRERYDNEGGSRTRDRRLSPHTSMLAGLSLSWELGRLGPFEHLDVRGSCDAIVWDYGAFLRPALSPTGLNELEPLGWVTATVVQVGSELSW